MAQRQDVLALFVTYLIAEKRLSKNSVSAYETDLRHLELFLKQKKSTLLRCDKQQMRQYLKLLHDRGLQSASVSRKISTFKNFYSFAQKNFGVANLGKSLIFPKLTQRLPKYLTEEEVHLLLQASLKDTSLKGARNHVMLLLLYATGMRISELLDLKFEQIIFTTGFIQVFGKGNKERLVPVPTGVLGTLRHYLDQILPAIAADKNEGTMLANFGHKPLLATQHVFVTRYRKKLLPLSRQTYWLYIKKLLLIAGVTKDISPHTLRHSLASHLLKNGADLRSLQMLLGHEHLSTVQIYTHLHDDEQRKEYDKSHPRA